MVKIQAAARGWMARKMLNIKTSKKTSTERSKDVSIKRSLKNLKIKQNLMKNEIFIPNQKYSENEISAAKKIQHHFKLRRSKGKNIISL